MILKLKRSSCFGIITLFLLSLTLTLFSYTSNVFSDQVNVTWTDTVGVTVDGNSITSNAATGWGNSGAASQENFTGNGGVGFTAARVDKYLMAGLSSSNLDASYASIEYAIFLYNNGSLHVYEKGVDKGSFGSYQIGDRFSVERVDSTIVCKKNGFIFYTSNTPTNAALLADFAIYGNDGTISDVAFIGITPGVPDAIADCGAIAGDTEVDLIWTAPTNHLSPITEYEVQYGTVADGNFDTYFTDYDAVPGATIIGLTRGTAYQFRVVAKNAVGAGPVSNIANATPHPVIVPTWTDTVGVTVDGNSITSNAVTGWGNSGAASQENFTGNGDVRFTAAQVDKYLMAGLSSSNLDASYASIEYAIFLYNNGSLHVYEKGVDKGLFGTYQIGDRFGVERFGSTIVYKKNGIIFYTSLTPTDAVLMVDFAIYETDGTFSDVSLFDGSDTGGVPSDTTRPSTPGSLAATAISVSQINLSWPTSTDDTGVTGYNIYRDSGSTPIATVSTTSYENTGLNQLTTYAYTVSAIDAAGNESNQSVSASATTSSGGDTTPPSIPVNLVATAISLSQINLSWVASSDNVGVTGYKIFRGGTEIEIAIAGVTTYSDTGLSASTLYSYTVSAYDVAGNESNQSVSASATTNSASGGGGTGGSGDGNSLDAADGNPIDAVYVDSEGNVGIGTTNPGIYKLAVNGTIKAKEIVVELTGWSDFVFKEDYTLMSLGQLEKYIVNNKHLPQIPSAEEVAMKGVSVGDMQSRLLQKIEELTLYIINMRKENDVLRNEKDLIKKRLESLETRKM